ncbi:Caspase domain [Geosmithia morbida]|uniref:Caspase domain n=1 Tax=Geosmithia morbida TaxID=1094350 RepID=A0A9P5D1L0_9HYPO|nr:Caspase domain [Geosmithia morbida]KAF4122867.1 Caspase domain [Geosmithia morbida]
MSYPGQGYNGSSNHSGGRHSQGYQQGGYGGYAPPAGPPPGAYQQHGYAPPPGPPPSGGGYGGYAPPSGPPPGYGNRPAYGGGGSSGRYDEDLAYGKLPPQQGSYGQPQGGHNGGGYSRGGRGGAPPPSAPQNFGHGAPPGYQFKYSRCTGTRKALLIGINYIGQKGELRGCINDVHNVMNFLIQQYHYKKEDMVILTDDQRNPVMQPTKANIFRAIQWLVKDADSDDSLFLHYSGHGGQAKDLEGEEDDGYDEVIYPVDYQTAGHIVDDELHMRVVRPLRAGVRLTAIFDSCHSATVLDLPYVYSTKGVLKEPNLAKEAGEGLLGALSSYAQGDLGGVAKSVFSFAKSAYKGDSAFKKTKDTRTSPADVVMWSGSKDDQTSADATIDSRATGAMSYAFIKALKANPQQSYVELLNSIRDILEKGYSQKPQLSSSHPIDTDLLFIM